MYKATRELNFGNGKVIKVGDIVENPSDLMISLNQVMFVKDEVVQEAKPAPKAEPKKKKTPKEEPKEELLIEDSSEVDVSVED